MKKLITLNNQDIPFKIYKRRGIRNITLSYSPGRGVSISAPKYYPLFLLERFLRSKTEWLMERIRKLPFRPTPSKKNQREEYVLKKEQARRIIQERAAYFAHIYDLRFNRISIRNTRSRWGSCSRDKNLSFSYKVAFLPDHLRDYIIVHEICHLKEMNHGKRFWGLVAQTFADHKELKRELKELSP